MKKGIIFFIVLFLTACGEVEEVHIEEEQDIVEPVVEVNPEINVNLGLEIVENQGKVVFLGETNLPNGTEIMVTLSNNSGFTAQDKTSVQSGSFESGPFSDKGNSLSGNYNVKISTPTANVQPSSVKDIIGENGINLTGSLIKSDATFGKRVEYNETFSVGSASSTSTEPTEDDIYNFMVKAYNDLTNYGADYIPEIHDPQVSRMASEEFDITLAEADQIFIKKEMEKFN